MLPQKLLILKHYEVSILIDRLYSQILSVIEESYVLLNQGKAINPPSTLLWFNIEKSKRVIALPSFVGAHINKVGLKWIASVPDNIYHGLPRASAILILNDEITGVPIAILEAAKISATRTVLSAILVLNNLCKNKKVQNLGIIGTGYISEQFIIALKKLNWQIQHICIYDQSDKRLNEFQKKFPRLSIKLMQSAESTIKENDIVLLATTATKPYIFDTSILKNQIILNISLRDLSKEFIFQSNNIVDNLDHLLSSSTSVFLAYKNNKDKRQLINGTIADLIKKNIKLDSNKAVIVSPMGLGILDIATADIIYQEALKANMGLMLTNFFNG